MMARQADKAHYWRLPTSVGEVRLLSAHYVRQHFSRHTHEGYGVGVIERGAMAFDYMGEGLVAASGQVNLVVPGEPHDGHAADDQGWIYRMFYLEPETLRRIASQVSGTPHDLPFFESGVIDDPSLAQMISSAHRLIESGGDPLAAETQLLRTLAMWIQHHSDDPPREPYPAPAPTAIARVRDLIHARHDETLALDDLAHVASLSPYHLVREFKRVTGLSPHLYLSQVRVQGAQKLIEQGHALSSVAQEVGFSDQSHLNRQFKRVMGITPGQYRKIVQDR